MTKFEQFHQRYNECLEKIDNFCWSCIPEVTVKMNEIYSEQYSEEEVEKYLFGQILIEDSKLQFENLGIEI